MLMKPTSKTNNWQAEQLKYLRDADYNGAKDGLLNLSEATWDILGGEPAAGAVFIYLFRRFGYPKFGWDGRNRVVQYLLTTPMDGVFLSVEPNVTGSRTFGFMLREEIYQACEAEERKQHEDWTNGFETWVKKEHGTEIIWLFDQDNDKLNRVWQVWVADKQECDFASETDAHNAFINDQEMIRRKYVEMYREVGESIIPLPHVNDRSDDSIMKHVHTALCDAINDLLRPVYVRDVMINIKGNVAWTEASDDHDRNAVKYAANSGCGVGNFQGH